MKLTQKLAKFSPFLNNGSAPPLRTASDTIPAEPEETVRVMSSTLQNDSADPDVLTQMHDVKFVSKNTLLEKLRITF